MSDALCEVADCARPRPEHQWVCVGCLAALQQHLGSLPALLAELATTYARADRLGVAGARGGGDRPLPYKPAAAEAWWLLANTLGSWARLLAEHARVEAPQGLDAAAAWLLRYSVSLAMHPAAGEALSEIRYAIREATAAIDRPPDLLAAGPCEVDGCPEVLYVPPERTTVICRACGARHDVTQRREWMLDYVAEMRVTGTTACDWVRLLADYRVPRGTWRSWRSRGQLAVDGVDSDGHQLYRFGDVHSLVIQSMAAKAALRPAA